MPVELNASESDFAARFDALVKAKRDAEADVTATVAQIIADVRKRGDAALHELNAKFDKVDSARLGLRISEAEIDAAAAQVDKKTFQALQVAAERIRAFHARQKPSDDFYTDAQGVKLGHRWTPLDAVGLYVPGGKAAYPSSVLMNAVPAVVAGVRRVVVVVPTPGGELNPLVMAALKLAGVHEAYRVGGAQAVAALAYGTESIKPVDKITGPGNSFVVTAKRLVFGQVGIDNPAGPSEILVVADNKNDPSWIAADLLSQAEHDEVAQSVLITDDAAFAGRVGAAVRQQLSTMPRSEIATASWEKFGALITVKQLSDAAPLIDAIAPEHLELAVEDPQALAAKVRHAGAIFLGRHTPEAVGDYVAGPNHVLPTAGAARFASGLNLLDFMKRTTLVQCDDASLRQIGPAAVALAEAEGLHGHALSVAIRLNSGAA
ncbi:histidinol dehydrogenase [uncultured Ferrovibrio sp.]|jgi:histidinol dehydrogenase|uniref:histidinol dehydrogenase n=1 Tax=uncultured Ferrovibrio sp. TaxID=1576913 RepID=UPI0026364020|nr:histidinol dehydrogenase [uncultured Ferrovibrio sp.]